MKAKRRFLSVLLAAALTVCSLTLPASALRMQEPSFPDVDRDSWYYDNLRLLYQFEIIDGYTDGLFHPNDPLTRGQFIKMLGTYEGLYTATASKNVHWSEMYWNILNEAGVLETQTMKNGQLVVQPLFSLSAQALEQPITRNEMALLINNMLYSVYCEYTVKVPNAQSLITDYSALDPNFRNPIEQAYGKGILTGYTDGSFQGSRTLTRAEAVTVIARLFWGGKRVQVDGVELIIPAAPTDSFAFRYRTMSVEARRVALFGDANKTYFTSAADAGDNIVEVTVPVWKLNSSGQKYASKAYIQVHRLVADEVEAIFEEIFNDPERFPIKAVGGARYSDALRHAWGCAIDINPNENYYLHYATGQQSGSYWKPGEDPYSTTPNGSVVRAFAKYGWGWGGQGWTSGVDYMHFSILASGG